ncbi:MAG: hypothetical protein WKF71_19095 [Pyrinomonadaceae bacterium]
MDILDPATGTGTFIAELIDRINIHSIWNINTNTNCTPTKSPYCRITSPI